MGKIYFVVSGILLALFCVIMVVDRHLLNHHYSSFRDTIEKKDQELLAVQQQHRQIQSNLNKKLEAQQRTFHVVTAHRSLQTDDSTEPQPNAYPELKITDLGSYAQYNNETEFQDLVKELADSVEKPVNAKNIVKAFRSLDSAKLPRNQLISDTKNSQRVINLQAALFEAFCRKMGYNCSFELHWDMLGMKHFCKATLVSTQSDLDRATCYFGDIDNEPANNNRIVRQSEAVTILLPFLRFNLADDDYYEIMSDFHSFPIGGLYLHRIDVERHPESTTEEWCLEYRFSTDDKKKKGTETANKETDKISGLALTRALENQTHLRALSLLNGAKIISTSSEGMQSFRISFVDGRSSILIMGDTPVLPIKITARPITEE